MVEIEFYPIDVSYSVEQDKAVVNLFGKIVDGKQVCVRDESFEPYFLVVPKKANLDKIREKIEKTRVEKNGTISMVTKTEPCSKKLLGKNVNALKVFTKLPRDIPFIRNEIKNLDVETYEFDIQFTRRYLIDKDISPLTLCKASGEFINKKSRVSVMKSDKIEQLGDEVIENPNILAFDIETYNPLGRVIDEEKNPIVMVSFYGDKLKKVITWKQFKTNKNYIEFVGSELELLNRFKDVIESYKPDIITGYFSDGFDFPYIEARARKYKINLDIGLDYSSITVSKKGITTTKITGIAHLDIFKFIKRIMGTTFETDSYSLGSVAEEILGEKKGDINLEDLAYTWDKKQQHLGKFCDYNLQDSKLTFMLCNEIMPNIVELVKIVGLPIADVSRMSFSQLDEGYLIKQAKNLNEIVPNKPTHDQIKRRRQQTYTGAFVFKPTPGLYKDITIFDFRSLYPSIITSHNISPDTFNCKCCEDEKHVPGLDKYWFCSKKKGFISTVLEGIITRRMRIKEIMKGIDNKKLKLFNARQYALKTIGNSMYGYMGFFGARWYSIECARSITAYGRYYIKEVIDSAQKTGFKVLYSDTDSIFLLLDGKIKNDTKKFIESINANLPGLMELEYEGFYPRGIFVSVKEGVYGAKKKYALLSEDGQIKIKGFETIRRNWSFIAKETQREVLNIILKQGDPKKAFNYVKGIITDLKDRKIPIEKVVIHTQLQKAVSEYDSIGPHVAVAQMMMDRGISVGPGSLIEYVITKGKDKEKIRDRAKLPEEISKDDYDPDYYINNQIIPSVEKIFEVLGFEKDFLVKGIDQSRLDIYFK